MFDPVRLEVYWQRLLSILEEASWVIVRTSHSSVVREAWDFGCLLYDGEGRLVAQNTTVASKIGVHHTLIPEILALYPRESIEDGDIFIGNDPWLTSGHLYDVSLAMPIFYKSQLIAFAECIAHMSDIGGSLDNRSRDVYEEGLQIPICRIVKRGQEDREIVRFVERNIRVADQVMGDIRAMVACVRTMSRKLVAFLEEMRLLDIASLSDEILNRTEAAVRAGIRRDLQEGVYHGDAFGDSLHLATTITVGDGEVVIDYAGSALQTEDSTNCCFNHAYAWTVFAVKSLLDPEIPNNEGVFRAIRIVAPEGLILNPLPPAPVRNRAATAHFITPAVYNALGQAAQGRVLAESSSVIWLHRFVGRNAAGRFIAETALFNGGMGASACQDGQSTTSFPTNAATTSVEVIERLLPIRFLEKGLRRDSGGPGRFRGGLGQRISWVMTGERDLRVLVAVNRTRAAAQGMSGGAPGAVGAAWFNDTMLSGPAQFDLKMGDKMVLELPGGGGFGEPSERTRDRVMADVRAGLVSPRQARERYFADVLAVEMAAPEPHGLTSAEVG